MEGIATEQRIFAQFGEILRYPDAELAAKLRILADLLAPGHALAAQHMETFIGVSSDASMVFLEEHYTRAFDLAPQAPPYLSIYLFGAENPQRGQFMAGLNGAYAEAEYDCEGELPDHLALVLRYAAVSSPAEWEELREACLFAPLKMMSLALEKAGNPYSHLLASLKSYVRSLKSGELSHA